jgi:hypothetical protein
MLKPLSRWWPRALVASVMVVGLAQLSSAFLADTTSRASIVPTCATQERHTNVSSVGQNFGAELALFEEQGRELMDCRTGANGGASHVYETTSTK